MVIVSQFAAFLYHPVTWDDEPHWVVPHCLTHCSTGLGISTEFSKSTVGYCLTKWHLLQQSKPHIVCKWPWNQKINTHTQAIYVPFNTNILVLSYFITPMKPNVVPRVRVGSLQSLIVMLVSTGNRVSVTLACLKSIQRKSHVIKVFSIQVTYTWLST